MADWCTLSVCVILLWDIIKKGLLMWLMYRMIFIHISGSGGTDFCFVLFFIKVYD